MSLKSVLLNLNKHFFLFYFNFYIFLSSRSIITHLIISNMLKTISKKFIQKNLKEDLLHHHL